MTRITNQEAFIVKAKEIHANKYDYSLVNYNKSSEKVQIICPEHGVFEKTPNKHLQGQGCPVCGRNRTKIGIAEFAKRANGVHHGYYDYSKVKYVASNKKVEIVCPIHGSFWQTPHSHIVLHQNCPKCGHAMAGDKRRGENNVAHRDDVKQKKAATCENHFSVKTWAESDEGRQRLHDIIVNEGKLDLMKATCRERYGTDFWTQSDEGRQVLRELMSSDEMQQKVKDGYDAAYGMHYMQIDEGRERAKLYIDDERREKMQSSLTQRYGVPYVVFSDEEIQCNLQKSWETKRRNGTFNTSKPEETLYLLLCDAFGKEDVEQQYSSDSRYPFACDFYVKSLDLFIELNAHWSHGGHWFNEYDENDLKQLIAWQEKAKQKGSCYYHAAIRVWTERDLLKKKTAENNHLNYIVFWQQDLSDAREYLSSISRPE